MTTRWSAEEEASIIAELCRRTAVDPEFRGLALKDPAAAIAKMTTKSVPADVAYRFVNRTGDPLPSSDRVRTIELPDAIPEAGELSDAELEQIAGGDYANQAGYTV